MRISLTPRIALVFSAITLLAIGSLYMYVAPGLQTRLVNQKLDELAGAGHHQSRGIEQTVGGSATLRAVNAKVARAALSSGARVTLLTVSVAVAPHGPQLSLLADSSNRRAARTLGFPVAYRAVRT